MEVLNENQEKEAAKEKLQKYKKQVQNEGRSPKEGEKPESIDKLKNYF